MKMIRLQPIKLVRIVVLLAAVAALMPSCVSRKKLTYLQSSEDSNDTISLFKLERTDYVLQVNDIVNIDIRSLNLDANTIFNGTQGQGNQNLNAGEIIFYLQGY